MRLASCVLFYVVSLSIALLDCKEYSGSAGIVDPCCHGLAYLYSFGPSFGDQQTTICDGASNDD